MRKAVLLFNEHHTPNHVDESVNDVVQDSARQSLVQRLFPRKGGGGGGRGGGGSRSSGKGGKGGKGSSSTPPAARKGASSSFSSSSSARPFSVKGLFGGGKSGRTATAYGDGGGKRFVIGSGGGGTCDKFCGREAGGGTRNDVYGTSRFGSGYPYGSYGSYVNQRPLPFVFYPTPVSYHYYGGDEYLDDVNRPGGPLTSAIVQPSYNTSLVTYRLVGDNSSVVVVFDALVANCSVARTYSNSGLSPFSSFSPSLGSYPLPEQIIQYYRGSSFALSLDGYNNTAALPSNMPASNTSSLSQILDTTLPPMLNMTFLECLNATIGSSIPLVDPLSKPGLSAGAIAGIVIGSVFGFIALIALWVWSRKRWVVWREERLEHKKMRKRIQVFWTSRFGYREVGSKSRLKGEDDSIWGVEEDSGSAGVKKSGNGFGGSDKESETKDISKKSERV